MSTYAFQDTDQARQRLQILAEVYAQSTREFLQRLKPTSRLAIDLGCGPGYTTRLLAETLAVEQVVGLDASERFIAYAQEGASSPISFFCHDVTAVPFPVGPADLIYCRLLLTHLQNVPEVIARWATQLHPAGLLLLEEVEWIQTRQPTFSRYLQIVDALLKHQENRLYIGQFLHELPEVPLLERRQSQVQHVQVTTANAARMFLPNLRTWRNQPFIQEQYSPAELNQLEEELIRLLKEDHKTDDIAWGLRQMVFERI
jgi:trans-aconitate 2-methyltransferase